MVTTFNKERYTQLQYLRETGALNADDEKELSDMCSNYLFDLIETTPALQDIFIRLKNR